MIFVSGLLTPAKDQGESTETEKCCGAWFGDCVNDDIAVVDCVIASRRVVAKSDDNGSVETASGNKLRRHRLKCLVSPVCGTGIVIGGLIVSYGDKSRSTRIVPPVGRKEGNIVSGVGRQCDYLGHARCG